MTEFIQVTTAIDTEKGAQIKNLRGNNAIIQKKVVNHNRLARTSIVLAHPFIGKRSDDINVAWRRKNLSNHIVSITHSLSLSPVYQPGYFVNIQVAGGEKTRWQRLHKRERSSTKPGQGRSYLFFSAMNYAIIAAKLRAGFGIDVGDRVDRRQRCGK